MPMQYSEDSKKANNVAKDPRRGGVEEAILWGKKEAILRGEEGGAYFVLI